MVGVEVVGARVTTGEVGTAGASPPPVGNVVGADVVGAEGVGADVVGAEGVGADVVGTAGTAVGGAGIEASFNCRKRSQYPSSSARTLSSSGLAAARRPFLPFIFSAVTPDALAATATRQKMAATLIFILLCVRRSGIYPVRPQVPIYGAGQSKNYCYESFFSCSAIISRVPNRTVEIWTVWLLGAGYQMKQTGGSPRCVYNCLLPSL